ncbi:rab-GTPase-TBC domain-containing protein [Scenedesmus sp. NREL 46B-D3]|nr:rab-GTPase-TBC domain-containing protein [Scenedesmus sp. NREL 46B-D3]
MRRFGGLKGLFNNEKKAIKLLEDDEIVTLQVGKTVWDQAPRQMRVELWMSSLQRRGVGVSAAAKYEDMLLTPVNDEAVSDIDKDVARSFPNTRRFAAPEGQEALRRVLHAYAAYDPEVGYCQGMNFVAGLLLMYLPERHAFGGLVVLMQDRGLRRYYSTDMSLLQAHLWQLGRLIPPRLNAHLESLGVLPLLYGASWLMTCFSADFPASFSARVMDVILHGWMMDQALLKAAVAVLVRCEQRLLQLNDMEDCLALLKAEAPTWQDAVLHDVLTDAFAEPWTAQQQLLLSSVEGAESVAEAMDRVHQTNRAAAAAAAAAATSSGNTFPTAAAGSSSRRGTRGEDDGIQIIAAPAGIRASLSSGALPGGGGSSGGGSRNSRTGGVPLMGPPPSPKRPLSTPPSVAVSDAGSDRESIHSQPGLAAAAAAAAGHSPGESAWDPFTSLLDSSSHPTAPQTSAAAGSSSGGSRDSSALQSGSSTAAGRQQQQPTVQLGSKGIMQELRQQLDELSFSQLSQQQNTGVA